MEQEASKAGLIFSTGEMEACFLMADPAQWRKVIRAVLQNALQATAPAGTIETRLQSMTLPVAQAADLGVAAVDVIRWEVKDRGPGMSAEMLGRAFEPFFSTRAKKESLGLGLTIAHSVTRLHGGQIELHSGEGAGTTVTIWLPKVAPEK